MCSEGGSRRTLTSKLTIAPFALPPQYLQGISARYCINFPLITKAMRPWQYYPIYPLFIAPTEIDNFSRRIFPLLGTPENGLGAIRVGDVWQFLTPRGNPLIQNDGFSCCRTAEKNVRSFLDDSLFGTTLRRCRLPYPGTISLSRRIREIWLVWNFCGLLNENLQLLNRISKSTTFLFYIDYCLSIVCALMRELLDCYHITVCALISELDYCLNIVGALIRELYYCPSSVWALISELNYCLSIVWALMSELDYCLSTVCASIAN